MTTMVELLVAAERVRGEMPGFRSIPMSEDVVKEMGIMAAFEITTGAHAGHLIAIKDVTMGQDGSILIDYKAVDKNNNDAPESAFPNIGKDVGAVVDYFMIDAAIQDLRAREASGE